MSDLEARLANKVQLTTDGHKAYLTAVSEVDFDADYAMLIKIFANDMVPGPGRYSPPKCIGTQTQTIKGNPDPSYINTSFAERQNLTMRMSMRRFTRLTDAFSKKSENRHALAVYFVGSGESPCRSRALQKERRNFKLRHYQIFARRALRC
jgi:hypothetical protein